jgi:hypothetical protein
MAGHTDRLHIKMIKFFTKKEAGTLLPDVPRDVSAGGEVVSAPGVRDLLETRPHNALFEELVGINRANGVNPADEEPDGPVQYEHGDLVPMQGDTCWANGRTVSRAEIDERFGKVTL